MKKFEAKEFNLPAQAGIGELKGISQKTIEEHIKLYQGYVKHANLILEKMPEYAMWAEKDPFVTYYNSELQRRFSFEYNGIRNHEIYFDSLSGGAKEISDGDLKNKIEEDFGSFDEWLANFKNIGLTRGIGWAILYWDRKDKRLLNAWIDEQHLGQLQDCAPILALDMWEHSYVADYQPSGKKQYIEDFFENLNWERVESNFTEAIK